VPRRAQGPVPPGARPAPWNSCPAIGGDR